MATGFNFEWIVASPAGAPDPSLAIAGSRAGAIGLLNLEYSRDEAASRLAASRLVALGRGRCGVLVDGRSQLLSAILAEPIDGLDLVVVANPDHARLQDLVRRVHETRRRVAVVATCLAVAEAAEAAAADAVIVKGDESGGWVGNDSTFVLLQQCVDRLRIPVFAQGGVGLHTAAACYVAGAAGAVLDGQLLLARESPLPDAVKSEIRTMDGSETVCLGSELGARFRIFSRPLLPSVADLQQVESVLERGDIPGASDLELAWRTEVRPRVDWQDLTTSVLAVGQDAAFAADLARRFCTVGGIVAGLDAAIASQCRSAQNGNPLAEGSALARSHGTRYPIVQGPMTRVSDRAAFAAAVADAGALPFLALALMRGPEVAALLEETKDLLGDRPWGAGILGFVPHELRQEQLTAIRANRPPFALIAGGRPDQARGLEDDGIRTYLHVPSPGLLSLYVKDGARRFVFEGRECGGHVGPRSSFVLWDTMVRAILEELPVGTDGSDYHVLFAGGIHDGLSAAMVAAMAAPLTERGVHVGILLGTAYLFTEEVVSSGAITATFQQAAVAGGATALLETGPGHATRCLTSPFVDEFRDTKRALRRENAEPEEIRNRLEVLNLGRLRIAAKGTDRHPRFDEDPSAPKLVSLDAEEQWARGMFMIGQVAELRHEVCTVEELHRGIAAGADERLAALSIETSVDEGVRLGAEVSQPPADVAIVGIGCIFPGAADLPSFWDNILNKVDAITEIPSSRWDWRQYFDPERSAPDKVYSRWGGFIDPVPFDPVAFGMPPNSLWSIEPFQLLGLLVAEAALRDAGYAERPFARDRTSVIFGAGGGGADLAVGYTVRSSLPMLFGDLGTQLTAELGDALPEWTEDSFPGLLMNVAAGRIANRFDLGGTNYTVDAACASSLAAVSLAVREIQTGTSDMAIVGGIDAIQNPFAYLCFSKTQALSPTGRSRPFDAEADGIAISEGFAAVVLKRVSDAERDGDRIYAVIKGVGSASDGRDRSLTAPRPEGQMRALRRAYAHAGFSPATVGLVEAHGTGTVAGDRAEAEALSAVFSEAGAAEQGCALGSVKSMIGHTKATAGVAGLIKATLALHHRVLPATLGVGSPNPKAGFEASPFYVNTETRPWIEGPGQHPRRAGVSAFGFGGTDFHTVLEEYTGGFLPDREPALDQWPAEVFLWRRGSGSDLVEAIDALADELGRGAQPALADLAYTLALAASSADAEAATLAIVADSLPDLERKLGAAKELIGAGEERKHTPDGIHYAERPLAADGKIAFLFPGQGSQFVNMAREMTVVFPEARECFERADRVLAGRHAQPLSGYVFPPPVFRPEAQADQETSLTDTHVAQPALGATDLAYLRVLRAFGVEPQMVAGHSYGEFVALAAAGSLGEDDLLLLSEARGRFISQDAGEERGAMAAVDAARDALEPLLADAELVIANVNAPEQTVVSGSKGAIERALAWCAENDLRARALPVACAFHSPYVEPAQRRLAEVLQTVAIASPRIPVFSNTTAGPYPEDPAAIAEILAQHLIKPVEFVHEIDAMYAAGARVFVEVGPRSVLSGLVGRILADRPHLAVPVDQPGRAGLVQLVHCLAGLAAEGVPLQPELLFRGRSVERLNLNGLVPYGTGAQPSSALWLVDGGRARPAARFADGSPVPPNLRLDGLAMTTNFDGEQLGSPSQEAVPAQRGTRAPATAPTAQTGERVGDVMTRHLELMQQFLEAQQAVVLAYLGQPREAENAGRPARAAEPGAGHMEGREAVLAPRAILPPAPQPQPVAAAPAPSPLPSPDPEPVPAAEVTSNGHHRSLTADLGDRLLEIVSERTGYPTDMLELDADLEADLGIDSIKRVEIVGTMIQTMSLPGGTPPDVEDITSSRTLRQAIAALEALSDPGRTAVAAATSVASEERPPRPFDHAPAAEQESAGARISRFVVQPAAAPSVPEATAPLTGDGVVVIVDDESGVGEALAERLRGRGDRVQRIVVAAGGLAEPGAVARLAEELSERHGAVKGLVYLQALRSTAPADGADLNSELTGLFHLTRALQPALEQAADDGGAVVLGATAFGGSFALDRLDGGTFRPEHGAIGGFLKSLAWEWPTVRVKAVDLARTDPAAMADVLMSEIVASDGIVEVGYSDGRRMVAELQPQPLHGRSSAPIVTSESVVLITGGGRGITAEAALTLAETHKPTLVLVGRTPPPSGDEDPQTAGLTDPRELRQALLERLRGERPTVTPAVVEAEYRALLSARELRANLSRLRSTGARVEYLTGDVADGTAFGALIDGVYETYGRIDGVIHGAGVIEDKLVRDKEPASFARVIATKAGAAHVLASRLRPETLQFLVFFGSVAGRFGNRGQGDYAAASEILNKLAQDLDRRWPGRVVSINWGPWLTAGMVSPELQREFARRGVELIPIDVGCRHFADELLLGKKGEVEVVIGGATALAGDEPGGTTAAREPLDEHPLPLLARNSSVVRTPQGTVEVRRTFALENDLYLDDHRVDGRPVLPFAVAMELLAETAAAGHPELTVGSLREIRLLRGITVDDTGYAVRAAAVPPRSDNGAGDHGGPGLSLEVTITSLDGDHPHYRAIADLRQPMQAAPEIEPPTPLADLEPFPMSVAAAYRDLLFHGPAFQHIASVEGMDERGARAVLLPSEPAGCLSGSPECDWLFDPVLVDCAFQMQVLWARLHWDMTLLPGAVGDIVRAAADGFTGEAVLHELRVRPESTPPLCHCDHYFYARDGRLLATMTNVQGIGSKALNRLGGVPA